MMKKIAMKNVSRPEISSVFSSISILGRLRGQRLAGDRLRGGRVRRGGGRGAAVRRRRLEVGLTRLLRLGTWDGGWDKYIYIYK